MTRSQLVFSNMHSLTKAEKRLPVLFLTFELSSLFSPLCMVTTGERVVPEKYVEITYYDFGLNITMKAERRDLREIRQKVRLTHIAERKTL